MKPKSLNGLENHEASKKPYTVIRIVRIPQDLPGKTALCLIIRNWDSSHSIKRRVASDREAFDAAAASRMSRGERARRWAHYESLQHYPADLGYSRGRGSMAEQNNHESGFSPSSVRTDHFVKSSSSGFVGIATNVDQILGHKLHWLHAPGCINTIERLNQLHYRHYTWSRTTIMDFSTVIIVGPAYDYFYDTSTWDLGLGGIMDSSTVMIPP